MRDDFYSDNKTEQEKLRNLKELENELANLIEENRKTEKLLEEEEEKNFKKIQKYFKMNAVH